MLYMGKTGIKIYSSVINNTGQKNKWEKIVDNDKNN